MSIHRQGTNGWDDWYWRTSKSLESEHRASGLSCMIHQSTYDTRKTSTTVWITGQRGVPGDPKSDRYLRDEKFTNRDDAISWIESFKNPWDIYENECKIPPRPESYNDPDRPSNELPPPPKKKQRGFF